MGLNFSKSKLIGINISIHFLEDAANFLSCRIKGAKFNFLEVPVGLKSKKVSGWELLIKKMKARLSNWKGIILNLGGRITLLKSVWSSLPIFILSFYKAPVTICKEITKMQNNFL
ncbi:unnamed protein product [Lathyrus sativus]|nr:unnamed protein product [Lathyrus sativus]